MSFKRNITITLSCIVTECLLSIFPIIIFAYIFFLTDKMQEIFFTLLIIPYLILIINAFLIVISVIAQIFIKTKYYLKSECLVIASKDNVQQILFEEIAGITYDFGNLIKFSNHSSQLVLFDNENKCLLSIDNPSIIMVHMIKKKCKNAKVCYYNSKRFLYLFLLINVIGIIALAIIKAISVI